MRYSEDFPIDDILYDEEAVFQRFIANMLNHYGINLATHSNPLSGYVTIVAYDGKEDSDILVPSEYYEIKEEDDDDEEGKEASAD